MVTDVLPGADHQATPSASEYATRLQRVQAAMAEQSLSALVVTDPANLFYLTGYNAWSFYTPQCLVVPADGDMVFFARAMDADGTLSTATVLSSANVEGYPEELVHRSDVHPYEWITQRIRERNLVSPGEGVLVGVEGDSQYFPARGLWALTRGLSPVVLQDSKELVNWVRVLKSDFELDRMRIAGTIAQLSMETALNGVRAGRRQCDVAAEIVSVQTAGTTSHGGDYPSMVPMMPTGQRGKAPHLAWTDQKFVSGEVTMIELAGVYERYNVPVARTVMLGEPSPSLRHMEDVVRDGLAAVLEAIKPGVPARDVHAVWDAIIRAQGLSKASRLGYSIGIGFPPDWGERTFSIRAEDSTVLQERMCFHLVTWMWRDGAGYMQSEPVIVTADGVERLTDLTSGLTVNR
jgi:ectoine hydrolase